jgi:shikimate dehydrogenase
VTAGSRLRVGVIGDPVAHSISPAMHQPALDALDIPATYERWPTTAEQLPARIASLRVAGVLGANVTVPHKMAVMDLVDEVSPLARRVGAVNTIVNRDGNLFGDNTDVYGFATALAGVCPNVASSAALVLGAGGAARGVVLALNQLGVRLILVANRDPDRAKTLASELGLDSIHPIDSGEMSLKVALSSTNLLINATSLGWRPGEIPVIPELLDRLPPDALVVDLTYRDTDLLIAARNRGLPTLDGLPMLVLQGAKAFELFTGQAAPVEIMMEAALQAREVRK